MPPKIAHWIIWFSFPENSSYLYIGRHTKGNNLLATSCCCRTPPWCLVRIIQLPDSRFCFLRWTHTTIKQQRKRWVRSPGFCAQATVVADWQTWEWEGERKSDVINRVQVNHLMLRFLLQNLNLLHTGPFGDLQWVYALEMKVDESHGGIGQLTAATRSSQSFFSSDSTSRILVMASSTSRLE